MKPAYQPSRRQRFGSGKVGTNPAKTRAKPLKRPAQARAKFTVQAIYDAFVRIWRRDGWPGVTTREVAAETGIAVGTLYGYFPSKLAILSGYVRHCIDAILARIQTDVVEATDLRWQERLCRLVRLTCEVSARDMPYFDHGMFMLEHEFAETKHHRRVYEEMLKAWRLGVAACRDLPNVPSSHAVESAFVAAWGGRRYLLLVQPRSMDRERWVEDMQRCCLSIVADR